VVDLFYDLRVLLKFPVRRDVDPCDVVVRLLAFLARDIEVIEPPGDDGDLAAHIIEVILHLERVSCLPEGPGEGVADDGVPDVADVQRAVRVRARVFEDDPTGTALESPVAGLERLTDGLGEECGAEPEVDVGAGGLDPDIAEFGVRREPRCDIGGDLRGGPLLNLCKFERYR